MSSYYARIIQGMSTERLVAITGRLQSGLIRVIDVDINGNPIGSPSYVPANVQEVPLELGPDGFLVEYTGDEDTEIDWKKHEDSELGEGSEGKSSSDVSGLSTTNPAARAFPELQGE